MIRRPHPWSRRWRAFMSASEQTLLLASLLVSWPLLTRTQRRRHVPASVLRGSGVVGNYNVRDLMPGMSYLPDRSGKQHHLRLGSAAGPEIIQGALVTSGTSGAYVSSPDSAALSITGDITLEWHGSPDTLTPAANQTLVAKWNTTGNQRGYLLLLTTTGALLLQASNDGTAIPVSSTSSVTLGSVLGTVQRFGVRAQLDVDNGAAQASARFFYTVDEGTTWTELGTERLTAGATSIFDPTAELNLLALQGTSAAYSGKVNRAKVHTGLHSAGNLVTVFDANFMAQPDGILSFRESSANAAVVSLKGAGARVRNGALQQPGTSGNCVNTADTSALDIAGDITFDVHVAPDDWTGAGIQALVTKRDGGTQNSWQFRLTATTGRPELVFSTDGTAVAALSATANPATSDGVALWVRGCRNSTSGDARFYTSPDGVAWTQLGATVSAAAGAIFNGSTNVFIGSFDLGTTQAFVGKIHRVRIYNSDLGSGSGTPVFDLDFADWSPESHVWQEKSANAAWCVLRSTGVGADTNDPLLLRPYVGVPHLYLPGTSSNSVSTPDAAALDVTGNMQLEFYGAADDWTPSTKQALISKWNPTGDQRSYTLFINTDGKLQYQTSDNGTSGAIRTWDSSVALPVVDGQKVGIKVERNGINVSFFTSNNDGATWTQLGTTQATGSANAAHVGTASLFVGMLGDAAANPFLGRIFRARVLDGIGGTVVFDTDFTRLNPEVSTFTESSANAATVTINRSSTGRKAVYVHRPVLLFGTDDYLAHPDHDDFDFGAGDAFTVATVIRFHGSPPVTTEVLMGKKGNLGDNTAGWVIDLPSTPKAEGRIADGATEFVPSTSNAMTAGRIVVPLLRRLQPQDYVSMEAVGARATTYAAGADPTSASLANTFELRIGQASNPGTNRSYNGEWFGADVIRRGLIDGEIEHLGRELVNA